jgi:hypothetical protein
MLFADAPKGRAGVDQQRVEQDEHEVGSSTRGNVKSLLLFRLFGLNYLPIPPQVW